MKLGLGVFLGHGSGGVGSGVTASVPATITVGQWTLADSPSAGGDTLSVNLITAPADGGSAITSYEFRRDAGAWSTLPGGTALGARNITVLSLTSANIELRAVNGIGNGLASDVKAATPTSSAFTARFGVGADQATGTGAFDTSLYSGATPANGTYGNFTVAAGVITPNGSQTAGTFSVGGWPVQVINGYRAVANQTQWNALTPANSAGKTVLVREAAAISVANTWNQGGDFNFATILGDGADCRSDTTSGTDSRKHFVTWETWDTKKLILDNIRLVTGSTAGAKVNAIKMVGTGAVGQNYVEDVYILRSSLICSRPDPFGDYSGGEASFPGGGASVGFIGNFRRLSVRDNYVLGGAGNPCIIVMRGGEHWAEIIGNWVDMHYLDGIGPPSCPMLYGGNLVTRPMSQTADAGNPHTDATQWLGSKGVAEASAFVKGQTRGQWQSFFSQDGDTEMTVRNIFVADDDLYQVSVADPIGVSIANCTWVPRTGASFPLTDPKGGIRFDLRYKGAIVGTNDIVNSVFRRGSSTIVAGVTETGNVDAQAWGLSSWNTNFPNWDMSSIPTLQNALQVHAAPSGGGAAAGKGASQNITSWGADRSSYVLNVTQPTVSSISLTPTAGGFTGTLRTDVGNNMVFYAVIPQAQGNPTYREIKERRVPNAAGYGDVWCSRANAGTDLAISITTASSATAYKLCVVAENGWSKQSAVTTANFTTVSTAITRSAVGTPAEVSASSINVPIPTSGVVNGDTLVMVIAHRSVQSVLTTPSGWSLIGTGVGFQSGSVELRVYRRVRDGSEGTSVTVSSSSSGQLLGVCAAYRGVSTDGAEATNNSFSFGSHATPTLSATNQSCILHIWGVLGGPTDVQTMPNAGDLVASFYDAGTRWWLGIENQLSVSAGTTTARTATSNGAPGWNGMQVELLKA